jgi:hypothetical protein
MPRRKKLPPMLEKMGTQYREALKAANAAHQTLIRMGPEHPEDSKIHAAVEKALKDADLQLYCTDIELHMDAPRYDDSLDEIIGACVEFRLCIRGIEEGDYPKIVRALRPLGLGRQLDHAKPYAIEYHVDLS